MRTIYVFYVNNLYEAKVYAFTQYLLLTAIHWVSLEYLRAYGRQRYVLYIYLTKNC